MIKCWSEKPEDMDLKMWVQVKRNARVYGNGFAEKIDGEWHVLDPSDVTIMVGNDGTTVIRHGLVDDVLPGGDDDQR